MNPKELPQAIQDAARALTDAILRDSQAQAYQAAISAMRSSPIAAALEKRFMDFYGDLNDRQQKGERLSEQEIQQFYAMRSEYNANPLIAARDGALSAFKPLLAEAAEQISVQIGLDFIELAKIE